MATAKTPFPTATETRIGRALTPQQIFDITAARERSLARLLMLYIGSGLFFMLLPGTFLGVWNLIRISSRASAEAISAPWIQAHGQAQLFGWIGTFILGIGFYSIPKLRRKEDFALWTAKVTWLLWTGGVALRWVTNIYQWHWRVFLPVSSALQLLAFALFFSTVAGHKPAHSPERVKGRLELWAMIVIGATLGLAASLIANLTGCVLQAVAGASPAFSPEFDSRFLVVAVWAFAVPAVWGFSAKWLPVFLRLKPKSSRLLAAVAFVTTIAVVLAIFGFQRTSSLLLLGCAICIPIALQLFAPTLGPAKSTGIHSTFPLFVRLAYAWAIAGAALATWAAFADNSSGIGGAGRHAMTVGFMATMVFCIGQRVLPAFSGMRVLWSPRLMFIGLELLTAGCLLRVVGEVLAYQDYFPPAWRWLPVSALFELSAVTILAINLVATFLSTPPSARLATITQSVRAAAK